LLLKLTLIGEVMAQLQQRRAEKEKKSDVEDSEGGDL
jgi:hypothetical protein